MTHRSSRRRRVVALTAAGLAIGLATAGAVVGTGSGAAAASDDAPADCAVPLPVSEIADGDIVHGLTVTKGTTPTGFTGEVLGILHDGIAPDIDMIMIDLDMPAFDRSGGVWQGMSGSPVYGTDNRLLGAVAYGLSWGPSRIAGITPYEFMDDYLTAPPTTVRLGKADARVVAERAGVTERQAAQGFEALPMPLGVAGVSARRLAQARTKGPAFLHKDTYVLGRSGADAAGPETIVPGGNLAASASYGDITFAGVGTATDVCDGEVVGFGHPLFGLGSTTLGLHPADAIFIQPESLGSPFKVANISPVAGTITDDRLTGVTGFFGAAPPASEVSSSVTYGERSRTGSTAVSVPEALPDATFFQLLVNQDRVLDGTYKGTSVQGWTIMGQDGSTPFELAFEDRFTGSGLGFESAYGVADLAYSLISIDGVTIDSLAVDADVTDSLERSEISSVQQRVGESWVKVSRRKPVKVEPGRSVKVRILLEGSAGSMAVPVPAIKVPRRAAGRAVLLVQGGDSLYSSFYGSTVAEIRSKVRNALRHDEIRVQLGTPDKIDQGDEYGEFFFRKPAAPKSFAVTRTLGPREHVVGGSKTITVKIG